MMCRLKSWRLAGDRAYSQIDVLKSNIERYMNEKNGGSCAGSAHGGDHWHVSLRNA